MGAEVVWLKSADVINGLMKFAQDTKITLTLVGQTHPSLWNRIFRRSVTSRLLAKARDFNFEAVAQEAITAKS
jgi:K+-sensing histidine kinase KdpD